MSVIVRVYGDLREVLGWSQKEVERGRNLGETLRKVPLLWESISKYPFDTLIILINGRNARLSGGLEAEVKEGDVIDVFPPAAGG
ncbi:MAG: MoaD family protein [Acidilobaceae archaeon]|nr:MoaD family protein [Acidilobaceae archaeon]MCX8165046.1 MoaD family protein [Acidilobaceae archaeon]MDW7974437.1 MoaD family protein [Sulfolobales archaeon]